ncbi:MAG: helix-turn-helix domain-containing protein [Lactobacillales bacterium]|jgi:Rgg/GadR/MutR family transcriptional activator|nr:helix-turn-helix domain-containing protein [Lactobacillales bacterium]
MEIGEIIRSIRKGKGLSQKELSKNIMSRSNLSELESGNYFCSYDKFIYLLKKLNVSLSEFEEILNNSMFSKEESAIYHFVCAVNSNDHQNICTTRDVLIKLQVSSPSQRISQMILLGDAIIEFLKNGKIIHSRKYDSFKKYLSSCDNWGIYEINLLNNTLFIYPIEDVISLSQQLIAKCTRYNSEKIEKTKTDIMINTSNLLIKNKLYKTALEFSNLGISYATKNNFLYEKIILEIHTLIAQSAIDNKIYPTIYDYIKILEFTGYKDNAKEYLTSFELLMKHRQSS